MTVYTPSPELVAVSWLRSLNLPFTSDVSTTLPAENKWTETCYVQATVTGGMSDPYDRGRNPLVRVDIWAGPKKYGEANSVAECIVDAVDAETGQGMDISITGRNGPNFRTVHLAEVSVWQPPKTLREPAEPGSKASLVSTTGGSRSGESSRAIQRLPNQVALARTTMLLAFVYQITRS